jgi:hypothetical protein
MAVPNTDPRVSLGRPLMASQAAQASSSPSSVEDRGDLVERGPVDPAGHVRMVRPVAAAAYSIGASSLVARVSQNLAASCLSSTAAASASQAAVRVASGKVVEVSSGDQRTRGARSRRWGRTGRSGRARRGGRR